MQDTNSELLLTVQEAASVLRCENKVIYDMLRDGRLDAFRLREPNGQWRIRCDSDGVPRFMGSTPGGGVE